MTEDQIDKALQHAAHLAEIQRRRVGREGIVLADKRVKALRRQQLGDGQVKCHLHLFIPRRKLIERDIRPRQASLQHAPQPVGQHRRPLRVKPAQLQLLRHPPFRHRLGEVQLLKQAVQEGPRRGAARELVRSQLRLFHDFADAGGINIQTRQQILPAAETMLLQSGVTGHPPVVGDAALQLARRQSRDGRRGRLPRGEIQFARSL